MQIGAIAQAFLLDRGRGYARSARSARSTHRCLQVPVADRVHKIVGALQVASPCVTRSCGTSYMFVRNHNIQKIKGKLSPKRVKMQSAHV